MSAPDLSLLGKRRYGPLFAVQFLGAFNDNLLKFGLLFLANFTIYKGQPEQAATLSNTATGLFILPYFLFSAFAGQLADSWDKARLVRLVKTAEVGIMALALAGFWFQSIPLLMTALFLIGCHSTLFGPVKYSILPQHLGLHEIMGGTGLIEAGTFLAILGGQLLAGIVAPWESGCIATGLAIVGLLFSFGVPPAPPAEPRLKIDFNPFRSTWNVISTARDGRGAWLSILGISWFFAVGAVLLGNFAPLVSGTLGADQHVVTLFLVIFSVSIGIGSLAVNRLLGGEVSARFVPISALLLSAFMVDLSLSAESFVIHTPDAGISAFVASPGSWRVMIDLAAISFASGMFIVPLYAILQTATPAGERSRVIAANNIVNAAVSVVLVAIVTALIARGTTVPGVIRLLGFSTLAVALISCWLLPETVIKWLVKLVLRLLYRVEVIGGENIPQPGERAVVVVNHVSWLDGVLLAAFLPGRPLFAVNTQIAGSWWMKPATKLFRAFPVDPTNPMSAKAMVKAVREGNCLVIFPEGRITVTGALMKVFDGPGMVADKADAPIVPVRIDGAQYSHLSRLRDKVRTRMFPKITLTVLPPRRFTMGEGLTARERRAVAGRRLYDEMSDMIFMTSAIDQSLFEALLAASEINGEDAPIVEDIRRQPMSYGRLIAASTALGAEIRTIVTARAFVAQAKLDSVIDSLAADGRQILYLEDLVGSIGFIARLRARFGSAARFHRRRKVAATSPGVILFTSGSEGMPKGVVLTHRNLLANCRQLGARIDFNSADTVLNALPVFHSFGMTGGTLLPILNGIKILLYPNPLHYRIVPALAYDSNATILFGTDTFLAGYARMAHGYDFYSLRYVFAGAERVREETRRIWAEKFGVRIFEGYGATETGPVIAVNTPMHFAAGSVGRLLPGIEARLEPIPGIAEGAKLAVRGPNVMAGYLKADAPGLLQPPAEGWHDTGDIVTIDPAGFVTIRGRAKRFAKIGGEMVSLPAVEGYANAVWPGFDHAVVTRADPRKGEQLVLFTTCREASASALQAWGRANGIAELAIPRDIRALDALPVLGTGKLDYVAIAALVGAATGAPEAVE